MSMIFIVFSALLCWMEKRRRSLPPLPHRSMPSSPIKSSDSLMSQSPSIKKRNGADRSVKSVLLNVVLPVISLTSAENDDYSSSDDANNTDIDEHEEDIISNHLLDLRSDVITTTFSHGPEQDSKPYPPMQNNLVNEPDRLQVHPTYPAQRRESFLYRSDSDNENSAPPRSSRHSSISSDGIHSDELVTPFAQILSTLNSVRANFVLLTNIRQNRFRRGSEGFHLNSRLCQLYEISDGSMIRDDMFKKLTMETMKEFDWCLDQLDTLKASMSISEMASNKFKRILDRELKENSETGVGGAEISAWVFNTFVDKQMDGLPNRDGKPLRARSRSLVKSLKKLSRSVSCSGSVPRFGVECLDEPGLEQLMEQVDTWDFDVFSLCQHTNNRPLTALTYTILQTRDLLRVFKIKPWVFMNYMSVVETHYLQDVPFHNSTHAADVVHATHVLLSAGSFEGIFSDLEILAAVFAAAVHDVDHPGVNNQFLVNSSSEMALMYNDESVLENHHLAVAFQLLQSENCDMLESFSKVERQRFRKMVIEMVLATDNAKHMNILGSLKTMVETKRLSEGGLKPLEIESFNEKMHVLKCLVHCADLSNPTRPLQFYEKWVERLMEEFFRQGDVEREKRMDISPMMDRHNANIEKSQVVFIDYVVHPLWETWADLVYPDAQVILTQLVSNREHYRSLCPASPQATPTATPKSSPFPPRKSMPAAIDSTKSKHLKNFANKEDTSFLMKNDIKLFHKRGSLIDTTDTNNNNNNNSFNKNNNIVKSNSIIESLKNTENRRKSDTDALNRDVADIKLVRQKLLRYAQNIDSVDSTDSSSTDSKESLVIEPLDTQDNNSVISVESTKRTKQEDDQKELSVTNDGIKHETTKAVSTTV